MISIVCLRNVKDMSSNIVDLEQSRSRFSSNSNSERCEVKPADDELTAVETLELVRTFALIKDQSRRRDALDYLKKISADIPAE